MVRGAAKLKIDAKNKDKMALDHGSDPKGSAFAFLKKLSHFYALIFSFIYMPLPLKSMNYLLQRFMPYIFPLFLLG